MFIETPPIKVYVKESFTTGIPFNFGPEKGIHGTLMGVDSIKRHSFSVMLEDNTIIPTVIQCGIFNTDPTIVKRHISLRYAIDTNCNFYKKYTVKIQNLIKGLEVVCSTTKYSGDYLFTAIPKNKSIRNHLIYFFDKDTGVLCYRALKNVKLIGSAGKTIPYQNETSTFRY